MLSEHFDRFFETLWDKFRRKKKIVSFSEPPPWDDWDLDPKFFSALSRWTIEHPDNSLDRILENICVGINNGNSLLELIPNSPFPARGLIGALGHLVKLGATISKAGKDVQAFAKDVVHWVGLVKSAFEHGNGGRFTSKTRKILAEMRALIDEICKWATARLEDGRWSRIGHALIVSKEIDEFKSRIAKARAIFMDLAVINLSQAQDAILEKVRDLIMVIRKTQTEQLSCILDELEAQKKAEARRQFLSQVLSTHVALNTAYNEQGKRPCDSDTRIEVLADIMAWVYDVSDDARRFLWLTGDPGSGKSAITASIARECKDDGILWAQFFINRNLGNTTNPAFYFPSIARQLADRSPDVALALHDTLKERPSLMDDISECQSGRLFVGSLKVAASTESSKPVVVIIDALDETDTTRLRYTAEIFSQALIDLPSNVKVFISSRTEDDIRKPFSATFHVNHAKHIHLDTAADSSIRDVSTFLVRNISEIVSRNGLDVLEWPGEDRMRGLCSRASGLFIWAVTVMKFVEDQINACGKECLNDVFDELNSKGMGDINVLYSTILRLVHRTQTDPWVFERFRQIVGCIVVLRKPLSLADIASLLNLRKTTTSEVVDIEHHVRRLRTILVAGADAINGQTIPRLHKSFFEFITSERAAPRFRVDIDTSNAEVAIQCLRQLIKLDNENTHKRRLCSPFRYALEFWMSHLPVGMQAGVAVASSLELLELQRLAQFSSRDDCRPFAHVVLSPDGSQIFSSSDHVIHHWNGESGGYIESPFRGHTGIVLSIAFSPDGRQVISGSGDKTLRLWDVQTGRLVGPHFEGHASLVTSVAFSPDGKKIISGSDDKTLRLWDAGSGQLIGSPFIGHTSTVHSVAFSPDGKQIISGSSDHTLRIWDARSGKLIRSPLEGHTGTVYSVAFSPDGNQIISASGDTTLRLWDARDGRPIGLPLHGHHAAVWSAAFSPCGAQIISGSFDHTLCLWDAQNGQAIGSPFKGHSDAVASVAFSPDGKYVISGSSDDTLRLWDAQSCRPIGSPFKGHTKSVYSVAFSPDGKKIISGSVDKTLRLWDVAKGQPAIEFPFKGHTDTVTSMAVSPDGRKIVSASLDNTVRIWDAQAGLCIGSPLKDKFKGVMSVAFSPDGRQIAVALSDCTVSLWDVNSRKLLASNRNDRIGKISFITFSCNGTHLITSSVDGTTQILDASNAEPVENLKPYYLSLSDSSKSLKFTIAQGSCHKEVGKPLLRWFPVDNANFGHWVYIDSTFIRRDKSGLITIMDMGEDHQKLRNCSDG